MIAVRYTYGTHGAGRRRLTLILPCPSLFLAYSACQRASWRVLGRNVCVRASTKTRNLAYDLGSVLSCVEKKVAYGEMVQTCNLAMGEDERQNPA
jgi:hypothetical protein